MRTYQILIVGAGPAGAECARTLSKQGLKVLLIDKGRSFHTNNFSSAGAPLEIMEEFHLPQTIVGTFWNRLAVYSSGEQCQWHSNHPKGVILDFATLREFLSNEACQQGTELKLGCSYTNHQVIGNQCVATLRNLTDRSDETIQCDLIIDATGTERNVIQKSQESNLNGVTATGIEFLIQVHPEDYAKYANTMSLYLGKEWMPQGYGWVFPMSAPFLKVGIARYFVAQQIVPHQPSMQFYMDQILKKTVQEPFQLIERHGKTLRYTYGRKDPHFQNRVIGIGDTVSTLNPMAGEGIRHAMFSGRLIGSFIHGLLHDEAVASKHYAKTLEKHFNLKWKISECHMKTLYQQKNDRHVDAILKAFNQLTFEEMLDFAFKYNWKSSFKFYKHFARQLVTIWFG